MYQQIYNLIATHIYGGVDLTAEMELVTTLLSTFGCVFFVAFPFVFIYKLLRG